MSHYYTRYCGEHGDYDADVDGDQDCPKCIKEGKTPMQKLQAENAELRKDAKRYRYLREHGDDAAEAGSEIWIMYDGIHMQQGGELDVIVDAAIAARSEG